MWLGTQSAYDLPQAPTLWCHAFYMDLIKPTDTGLPGMRRGFTESLSELSDLRSPMSSQEKQDRPIIMHDKQLSVCSFSLRKKFERTV